MKRLLCMALFMAVMVAGCGGALNERHAGHLDPEQIVLSSVSLESFGASASYESYIRSIILEERGEIDLAVNELSRAIQSDPADAHLRIRHAELLLRMGRNDRAMRQAARALMADPAASAAWVVLAEIHLKNNETQRAVTAARNGMRTAPMQPEAYLWLARYYVATGDMDTALLRVQDLLRISPDNAEGHRLAYELLDAQGQTGAADVHLLRHLIPTAETPELVRAAAQRMKENGNVTGGILRLERLLEIHPGDDQSREVLIDWLTEAGLRSRACAHIDTLGQGAIHASAVLLRARMYLRVGAYWNAREELEKLDDDADVAVEINALFEEIARELGPWHNGRLSPPDTGEQRP